MNFMNFLEQSLWNLVRKRKIEFDSQGNWVIIKEYEEKENLGKYSSFSFWTTELVLVSKEAWFDSSPKTFMNFFDLQHCVQALLQKQKKFVWKKFVYSSKLRATEPILIWKDVQLDCL